MSAVTFASPSMRAAGQDLAVSVSPLGLVELADEEFEVHGPRLNRYAQNWAFYLGHHWAYRRESGEPQITFNYVRALTDFLNNFTLSKGVQFKTPKATAHIVPALLNRVWEVDNEKKTLLWEIGQQAGVSGDVFIKVAWEPGYVDATGFAHPARVRVIPLNAAHCFPEFHPHDRDRLIRMKIKYRFWGTAPEGTRQVYSYTEILTDDMIEEYVNDELIDQRPNPLGIIPVAYWPNIQISGSPWGLSDAQDLVSLNREYNEKALEISDIINYHAAPVTIITGGKASNLEKGASKVWALPSDKAKVFNLEGGTSAVGPAMEYLERIKQALHEMAGVPESALGQIQPISNTSGVALAIQYQPTMQKYNMKTLSMGRGLQKVNNLILKTLFTFDPLTLYYDPDSSGIQEDGQANVLDPSDPLIYQTECQWPPPLPVDALIKLNEVQQKMGLGLESKRGALADLGEEFPDEKLQEIFSELVADAKDQAALDMIRANANAAILGLTGMVPDGDGGLIPQPVGASGEDSSTSSSASADAGPASISAFGPFQAEMMNDMTNDIVTQAYGTKIPQRRNPDTNS